MKAILSPAKKLNEKAVFPENLSYTEPVFVDKADKLVEVLRKFRPQDIAELMEISDKMAEMNYERFQQWDKQGEFPAVFLYNGDTYRGLDIKTFPKDKLDKLQEKVRIISGLYGILRPLDLIMPYRLEMKRKIGAGGAADLYEYWRDAVTEFLNKDLSGEPLVILASKEYANVVDRKKLDAPVIDIDFKDNRNGKLRTLGLFAKRARGAMARWIAENDIRDPEELKAFDGLGYRFNQDMSTDDKMVFIR